MRETLSAAAAARVIIHQLWPLEAENYTAKPWTLPNPFLRPLFSLSLVPMVKFSLASF